jgi:protein CWC15
MRELEKIKRERAEAKAKEVRVLHSICNTETKVMQEAERAAEEEEKREFDIARGNPLLNSKDFNLKRRYAIIHYHAILG